MEFICMGIMAGTEPYNAPLTEIDNAPTVAETPQGNWIISQTMDCHSDIVNVYTCLFCGKKFYSAYPFCNCGADMRGEEK